MKRYISAGIYVYFLPGLFFLALAIYLFSNKQNFFSKAEVTSGTIIKFIPVSSKNTMVYYPFVSFVAKSGQQIKFTSSVAYYSPNYMEGSKVKVFYDPTNPDNAEINGMYVFLIDPLIMGALGVFFFLMGLWVVLGQYHKRKKLELMTLNSKLLGIDKV